MNIITPKSIEQITSDMLIALEPVAEKHGVSFNRGPATYSAERFHFKLEVVKAGASNEEEARYDLNAPTRGLPARGTTFVSRGQEYAITGMTRTGKVVTLRAADNKEFTWPTTTVILLSKPAEALP